MSEGPNHDGLIVRSVSRSFGKRSEVAAVANVSLDVRPGEIVGLLGPNGAGKTTTIRMCSTLLAPTSGNIKIAGFDTTRDGRSARQHLGVVLGGDKGFYLRATARANLNFFADLMKVNSSTRTSQVDHRLDQVGLSDSADRRVETYSRGMVQRLHLARALLHNPPVLLLDEPTSGLDVESAIRVRELVASVRDAGAAILLTSHDMPEVEQLTARSYVIRHGTILYDGPTHVIGNAAGVRSVTSLLVHSPPVGLSEALGHVDGVYSVSIGGTGREALVTLYCSTEQGLVPSDLEGLSGIDFTGMSSRRPTLEESYLAIIREPVE